MTHRVIAYGVRKDGLGWLSPDFQVKEFACRDGSDKILVDLRLVHILQQIRDHFVRPVTINSAYRTKAYNARIGGATPYSYQKVRRMCERIERDTGFEKHITPIRFRTTVLTDIYDQTKDVKTAQAAAGHASPTMTMRRYAKGRDGVRRSGEIIDRVYGDE